MMRRPAGYAPDSMERRRLGRIGHLSSVAILGAAAFWSSEVDEATAAFDLAEAHGVNHLDIAPRYGNAQQVAGPGLATRRSRWFVACKTMQATRDDARADLEQSLSLLGIDQFDLYQLHGVTSVEDLDRRAGAVEALLAAREEGLVRHLGITGHDLGAPAAHLEAVRRHDLDTVMFPVYPRVWADPVYRADAERLLGHCIDHDLGAMAIKAVAHRPWGEVVPPPGNPWYQPHTDPALIARGVRFALSMPGITGICTPGSPALLPAVLAAAEAFVPMSAAERDAALRDSAADELIFPLAAKARRP